MSDVPFSSALPVGEPAARPPPFPWYHWRRWGFNFLMISIAVHLLLGVGATYLVVQSIQTKRKQAFTATPSTTNPSARTMEHKVQMAKKQQMMSAPASMKRITTTSNAQFVLPAMPPLPRMNSTVVPRVMAGMGGTGVSLSMGSSGGGSLNPGGAGGLSLFGIRTSSMGLVGTFYDLKQTKDGQPTPDMAVSLDAGDVTASAPPNVAYETLVRQFVSSGMNESVLNRFYRGPAPLYANQIFIPTMFAANGPKAFNLEDKVQPKRWIVVYRGKVTPPESGSFRFVGFGDDVIVVRLTGRIVLDGGLMLATGQHSKTFYPYPGIGTPMCVGDPTSVGGGSSYPIEIVIGERPGGEFNAFLLLEKVGAKYEKTSGGAPLLPILKLAPGPPPVAEGAAPPFAPDTSWSVWKGIPNVVPTPSSP